MRATESQQAAEAAVEVLIGELRDIKDEPTAAAHALQVGPQLLAELDPTPRAVWTGEVLSAAPGLDLGTLTESITSIDRKQGRRSAGGIVELLEPVELTDLLAMEMPPRVFLFEGLAQVRDLLMIHAFRGLGKSRFVHGLAVALASGGKFLRWRAPEPQGVLLIDGELPREDLQKMLSEAVLASDSAPSAPLRVLSSDLCGGTLRSLVSPEGQAQVEAHLDGVSFIIIDSLSTLCSGAGPENKTESWDAMQTWLLNLRQRGFTVLLVHHDGKGGVQRGTSKREDVLSQVVQLKRPQDYTPQQGCRVEVRFTKSRGLVGDAVEPFEATLSTSSGGVPAWTFQRIEDVRARQARELSADGLSQREIAQELGCGLATVNRALKRAKQNANH